ncbi:MAG: prepilin-type N-terminal cleavage/methylation domain-containing protein [Armatimonadota bacterium]|nr:prepilin-type N-terminal cleavage/methylation domain-containing protein [Armatimonadota bacterium]
MCSERIWHGSLVGREEGISLVEVLVALALLAILLLSLANVFEVRLVGAVNHERSTTLVFLAQQKAEELGTMLRADLKPGEFKSSMEQAGAFSGFPGYRFKVVQLPSPDEEELKRLKVVVWVDDNGDETLQPSEKRVELAIQISRRPK